MTSQPIFFQTDLAAAVTMSRSSATYFISEFVSQIGAVEQVEGRQGLQDEPPKRRLKLAT